VERDLTVVDERVVPADVAPAVVEAMREHGLDVWVYHATDWYVTDPDASARAAGIRHGAVFPDGGAGLRRQATHVTASNAEEGFATAIERFVMPWAVPAPPSGSTAGVETGTA
jgi:hypothetical protein